ncbi:MAG: APC family permease [Psittacicella sp.]
MHKNKQVGITTVVSLGIGGMVGAGIFALLGEITLNTGALSFLSFIISGILALLSGYSYSKIAEKYPTAGGVIDFFHLGGLKNPKVARSFSIIFLCTFSIAAAVIAKAFGSYASHLFNQSALWSHIDETALTVILALVTLSGSVVTGKISMLLTGLKVLIIAIFIVAAAFVIDPHKMSLPIPDTATGGSFINSLGLTYFAYAGYDVMANVGKDLKNPEKNMIRSFILAIAVVLLIYILLDFIVIENLSHPELKKYSSIAIAMAAKPLLGDFGFVLVSIAALVATASAVLAKLYAIFRSSNHLVTRKGLPGFFSQNFLGNTYGFYIWLITILIIENFISLKALGNVTSLFYLIIYSTIFYITLRIRKQLNKVNLIAIWVGFIGMLGVTILFLSNLADNHNWFQIIFLLGFISFAIIVGWREYGNNKIKS